MAADGILVDLNDWLEGPDLESDEENNTETPREEIGRLMAGMDPDSRNEIAALLTAAPQALHRGEYIHQVLKLARVKSTKWFDAPDMPFTHKSLLTQIPGGYDIYQSDDYNRVVTVLVGSKKQKFTAIAGALATEAEFFKPLCDNRWDCGRAGVIELEDHQPESFGIFITWIYTRDHHLAEGLVEIHPDVHSYTGLRVRTWSHKRRWVQLLHCYLLADYIGAPRFANHMMDALVLAYRDWVEDDQLPKTARESLFEDGQTEEMVGENTAESSPLRVMISDILSSLPVLRSPEEGTSFLRCFRRPAKPQNYLPPGHPAQHSPSSAHSLSMNASNALTNLPPNHPLPPHVQISPSQYQAWNPPQPFQTPHPRPWSRFTHAMLRRPNPKNKDMRFIEPENWKKIWEEPRCKYHIHKEGKNCFNEE
ncbi:hypothetical protein DSL72_006269 [Monilinia vaccinii-corymbosi]|uniref:BTB domain-containing protein n=1 Tax=Monilinia vaccinii-corymbosi TaxID=61207 RepID=A0A8A3PN10_9HELO|nr:hypothetical protein DSL72_006269 [Monilinia vaccinii-corymbosi]